MGSALAHWNLEDNSDFTKGLRRGLITSEHFNTRTSPQGRVWI